MTVVPRQSMAVRYRVRRRLERRGLTTRWPISQHAWIDRSDALDFPDHEPTLFIAPIYNYFPALLPSLLAQSSPHWHLLLIHDGPAKNLVHDAVNHFRDERIMYLETTKRYNDWGHSLRAIGFTIASELGEGFGSIVVTNADNYYVPAFVSRMNQEIMSGADMAYCNMVHSHMGWAALETRLETGRIDCACVVAKFSVAMSVGWQSREFAADWQYVRAVAHRSTAISKVTSCLAVHN